jgi:hypothetical protein
MMSAGIRKGTRHKHRHPMKKQDQTISNFEI